MNIQKSLAALSCAALLAGCNYDKNAVQDITAPDPGSRVRFFNFGVNAPGVNFYANDTKITATSSTSCATPPLSDACTTTGIESTTGTNYGGVGLAGLYSALTPGQYTITGRIAAATDKNLAISTLSTTIVDGKYYSFYQSGFYNATTKSVESFIVEDDMPAVDYAVPQVRFVNAISNSSPMTLYAKNTTTGVETAIGGEVAYKSAGTFVALPGSGNYDLSTRTTGSTTNAIARTGVSFSPGRIYTITARGDMTVTSTTATNRPFLDNTANR